MTGELNAVNAPKTACAKRDAAERERIKEVADKAAARANGPSMRVRETDSGISSTFPHNDDTTARLLLMADLGTCDPDFMAGILGQVAIIGAHGAKLNDTNSNFLLSVVRGVQPRDELEAMLAVQMGAIHQATMMMARRLNHVTNIPQQDAAERALNKLARTYSTQMQALKRYRTGGQQKVTVEHVTVNDGGQAIVGNIRKEA
ncbi:hypothetical protein [Pararhodobacter oceanensis]|uniref:hypothetical protein n=1 Tax=Pararhodobacter oceanensis TaxID=2172121 RepID=UPI003A8CC17C